MKSKAKKEKLSTKPFLSVDEKGVYEELFEPEYICDIKKIESEAYY